VNLQEDGFSITGLLFNGILTSLVASQTMIAFSCNSVKKNIPLKGKIKHGKHPDNNSIFFAY
jgi:hypothetical protein